MCSRSLFFTAAHFHLVLVAASFSHFVTAITQNFHVVLSTKKCLLRFFISRSKSLSPFFSLNKTRTFRINGTFRLK